MKVESTSVTNLVKAASSGTYYARLKLRGRLIWRSLDTDVFTVAKLRLPDKLKELRETAPPTVRAEGKMTFASAMEVYKAEINASPRLAESSKKFRLRSEFTLRRTWPLIFNQELRRITPEACAAYLQQFESGSSKYSPPNAKKKIRSGNSPTAVNALISFLQHVFAIGVKAGICYQNSADKLQRKAPSKKLLRLPNKTQFAAIVCHVRNTPGWGRVAGDLIEGLAYSGMRVGESRRLTWGHVDFERGLLTVPGYKTWAAPRTIPLIDNMRDLLQRIQSGTTPHHDRRIFEASEASVSLASACKAVGVPHMTHHDLRHLFATTCIEAGVDIPTVSRWLGHSDGGALAMKTYGHLRPEHSIEAAKKVRFS